MRTPGRTRVCWLRRLRDHETWDISPSGAGEVALVSSGMLFVGAHEVAIACFRADRVTLTQSCANGVGSISPARDPLKAG